MDKQNIRVFILFALSITGFLLFNAWQQEQPKSEVITKAPVLHAAKESLPQLPVTSKPRASQSQAKPAAKIIDVTTDTFNLKIDLHGGDVVYLDLPQYPQELGAEQGMILLDNSEERFYQAQSGLLSEKGPDSHSLGRAVYQSKQSSFALGNKDNLEVDLLYTNGSGLNITKRFAFKRGEYTVGVTYIVDNQSNEAFKGNLFGRLKRRPPEEQKGFGVMRTYTGAAVNTIEERYKKISFTDMQKKPFRSEVFGGWAAMVEHYFTGAWVPDSATTHNYQSEILADNAYAIGFIGPEIKVPANSSQHVSATLYMGPGIGSVLESVSPGLELTVDYGVLWWICQPIFWLLKNMFALIGNWGGAIILTTLIIKLLFYKLSAASYRSMGNMRKLQPRIENLKQRYGDDKQKFGQAVMSLYREEKINPLGGCLPILVQIPVFIALYWVLLESVELRQAPFIWWIQDLSTKDPFYVLPLLMGASMFLQQKLNPTPPDPIQAKVMMAMPIVFTFLFLQFPSGLVLYWLVNNILSLLQQWVITRKLDAVAMAK